MVVDISAYTVLSDEEITTKSEDLHIDKLDMNQLDILILEYEYKVLRMENQLRTSNISDEKRELILKKLDNRREAYFIMTKQLEKVK